MAHVGKKLAFGGSRGFRHLPMHLILLPFLFVLILLLPLSDVDKGAFQMRRFS